jgi:hypothetical protein
MWKEMVMAYFKALYQHLPGMTGKYGAYLVTLFIQPVSFLCLLLELSAYILHFKLCCTLQ